MDVIIEGQFGQEESITDVITATVDIKNCQTPILRINDKSSDLQGRILFSQGGFILGGKVNVTGETGYEAVRKLLTIAQGNYAILDPLRKPTAELNQALWLATDKLIAALPNLPQTEDTLLDKRPDRINDSAIRPKTGQIDLAPVMAAAGAPKDEGGADSVLKGRSAVEHRQTTNAKSPSRRYNESRWRFMKFVVQMGVGLGLCYLIMTNSSTMWEWTVGFGKNFGYDLENNAIFTGFQGAMENVGKQMAAKQMANIKNKKQPGKNSGK